jgi:two-component system LytT family response regulator
MRALLADDERLARAELRRLLAAHPEVEICGEARDAEEAATLIASLSPDLLFLDVQMPGRSVFDLLESLDAVPGVIFVTAHDEYALRAFEVSAVDYLLKPVVPARLGESLERAMRRRLRPPSRGLGPDSQIFVKDGERCWFVALKDLALLESEGNYTRLYFGQERPLLARSLNYLEERLDSGMFFRASRKHIVSLNWIASIHPWVNGGLIVKLKDGQEVEMSRRQASKFKEMMTL